VRASLEELERPATVTESAGTNRLMDEIVNWWRRGESNPRPKSLTVRSLHAYLVRFLLSPTVLRNEQERTAD